MTLRSPAPSLQYLFPLILLVLFIFQFYLMHHSLLLPHYPVLLIIIHILFNSFTPSATFLRLLKYYTQHHHSVGVHLQ